MEFVKDPIKSRKVFIWMLVLAILFLVGTGALAFVVYLKDARIGSLKTENQNLNDRITNLSTDSDKLKAEQESSGQSLAEQIVALKKEKKSLQDQLTIDQGKIAKIKTYNDFFKYLNQIIETHNGFDGWTDAEFQVGKTKAEAIGDTSFVSTVNSAWYEQSIPPTSRVMSVWKAIVAGIEGNY